ncbi:hypothetical protein LK429_00125 [Hoylesella buccalis]|uniref:hypothetical protein n=1 Tax=Hoylesella buccalis TaxID=28127 RepID=UPI001D13EB1F|nr:hypothetical protein [Hoylesella buccalis]UEA63032.1 hypothetical protein LK429_00125 [Hoylesella buccalis]UWP49678.1 hypothetical protein NQ518_00990 [Hoylesella buccalis ATCC 35310]
MTISKEALIGVRETLNDSLNWKETTKEQMTSLPFVFSKNRKNAEKFEEETQKFITDAFIFNQFELTKGDKEVNENLGWCEKYIQDLKEQDGKRMTIVQFLKTLQMIDYNTDARGWIEDEEYETWTMRKDYENFKMKINELISNVAQFIVRRLPEYDNAKWDF